MEPVSVALLMALAGGAGGEAGRQAWTSLTALVRRRSESRLEASPEPDGDSTLEVSTAEVELAALEAQPTDRARADLLVRTLLTRASEDAAFATALERWSRSAAPTVGDLSGSAHNEISGGRQYGPVVQGQSFSGLSFNVPPPPADR